MKIEDILSYLKIIRKWWWVIALLFGVTIGTMLTLAFLSETEYEAEVKVQVSAPPPQEVPLFSEFGRQGLSTEIAQTQTSFAELLQEGDAPRLALEAVPNVPLDLDDFREKITVEIPDGSLILRVSVLAPDAEMSAALANTLVDAALKQYGDLLARPTVNTRNFIEQQLEGSTKELKEAEADLMQFQIENKIGKLDNAIDSQYNLIRDLRKQGDFSWASGEASKAQAIEQTILERETELQNMIGLSAQYNDLVDRVDRARSTHTFLLDKAVESQIKENQIRALGAIQVITPAHPPRKPVAAINNKIFILGAVVSIMTGILLAFLLEYLSVSGTLRNARTHSSEIVTLSDNVGEQASI